MNDQRIDGSDDPGAIEDEAIAWLVRMRGPDAASLHARFEQWLAQSAAHARAYEWAARHFEDAAILKQSPRHGSGSRRSPSPPHWLVAGVAAAAAASVLLVAGVRNSWDHPAVQKPSLLAAESLLATRRGEIRTFHLSDGSQVTLDTNSKLAFSIGASTRHLDLEGGKARITIAHDPRPFIVTAGAGKIIAKNATFDVGYDDDRNVLVQLISGGADIQPQAQPATLVVPVRSVMTGGSFGYRASDFAPMPITSHWRAVDDSDWPSGWAAYRSVPLAVLIGQANRYSDSPIILDGTGVGSLEASGRFRLTDTDAFVGRIAEVFDLAVSHQADGIHLSRR